MLRGSGSRSAKAKAAAARLSASAAHSRQASSAASRDAVPPSWWGVSDPSRFRSGAIPPAGSGPAVFLAATHASPGTFLRDASQAIQLVADSVLARPADVAAALGKDEDKDLSKQALRIREDTTGLIGSALTESVRCDAARRAASGGEAAALSRKVWVHSAALAEVRAHAISVRPAAPEHASGGLMYDATTHSMVEAREGDCPTLLSPWGIAMTKAGRIRPRDDALDSRKASRSSNESMEELVRRSEKEEEESGKRGQPVPTPLAGASRVVVQARVVFGTLESDAGKRVVAPPAELDEAAAVGIEGPAGWRARQWSHPYGAADASGWGRAACAQDGDAEEENDVGDDAGSGDETDDRPRGRGTLASVDGTDAVASTAIASAQARSRWWASEAALSRARSLAAVEAAAKADKDASDSEDGSDAKKGPARAAVLRRSAIEHAAVRARMAAATAYASTPSASTGRMAPPSTWKDGPSTASLASGPLLGDEGVASPLVAGEGKAPWSARHETALRGLMARYTHWHEATFEISLVRPAPSWGRSMGLAKTGLDGDPRGKNGEDDEEDDDDDEDDEHRAGGEGTSEERRAAALRRDLRRGVRADAPGRSGAGPVGAPRGLEAVLTRLAWEGKGLAGKGLRLFAEATGGVVLRGPDMVPEHGGWRLIGIDEAVPRGAWEADRRAAGAWEAAQGMAVASLTSGTDSDWTLGAEFLSTLPAHMAARMGAADVGANHPTAVMSNVALLCRTQGPLMRHWPPAALGVAGNQRNLRAAMRERASWLDVEDEHDAARGSHGKGQARADAADAADGSSDSEGAAVGSVQGCEGNEEEEEVPSPAEFGVGWHDGWEGVGPSEAMGQHMEMGQGSTLLLGDGRWAAMPTSTLYTWIGGDDEYAWEKRFGKGFKPRQEESAEGDDEQSDEEEPDSDDDDEAADSAVSVEDLVSKPAPPAWAVAAVRQLAAMADDSARA